MVKIVRMKTCSLKWAIRSQALRVAMVRPMGAVQRLNVGGLEKPNQLR
jgi:hypothetical protein